ncbi:GntR family transcriptional regulator [Ornithinibacillus gellani]|uniref:GntR family transcriptional regulator n=1 Tax=Ornithinibacillus gellani TaxID=2293253 RepID=UPI000F466906|nr:GntR family transcriptional regulator [Ornithinibacillus gellani]TQS71867.1 GntR family transcriptional regulator [Ornithinibacillus gellani]
MDIRPQQLKKSKKPLYVIVYEKLYHFIMEGTFPPDSKLPTEPELAKMFGVSRVTLRQALSLLRDDGLVKNIHGKGNYITKTHNPKQKAGMEQLSNPLHKCHTIESFDKVELEYRIDVTSDYTRKILQRDTAAVVVCERWYHNGPHIVAYALSMMAIDAVKELHLDLENEDELLEMLETGVYDQANSQTIDVVYSSSANASTQKYHIHKGKQFHLLTDQVFISDRYPIMYNKYYIPLDYFHLKMNILS